MDDAAASDRMGNGIGTPRRVELVDDAADVELGGIGPTQQLFTPDVAARHLLNVIAKLRPTDTGRCLAWDGTEILP